MKSEIHILGIRHHGPGSASSVLNALYTLQPQALCLEFPADGAPLISRLQSTHITPPVAGIIYEAKNKDRLALLPFAAFSPEWVSLHYAREHGIPVIPMDLPFSIQREIESQQSSTSIRSEDVLKKLAQLAGFQQVENWWDHYLEREGQPLEIFEQLQNIMQLVREVQPTQSLNQHREAYMRNIIRKESKKYENLAVVCGAYHGPALTDRTHTARSDQALLKGLKAQKVKTSLIPYSYKRMTQQSGYASGIVSPKFYEFLFQHKDRAHEQWLGFAGRALRQKGFLCSIDENISAIQLAEQLAYMRKMNHPGLSELLEAAEATLCKGQKERLYVIHEEVMIGNDIGYIPIEEQEAPLLEDFMALIKRYRLSNFWRPESPISSPQKDLDLRKKSHLATSQLLHQCIILGMNWAHPLLKNSRKLGSFHESWTFQWDIEVEIQLHHACSLGLTVREAAENRMLEQFIDAHSLRALLHLLDHAIKAQLHPMSQQLLNKLESLSAASEDIHEMLATNNRLLEIMRYGSVRNIDEEQLYKICEQLHERICTQLPYSCGKMEEDWSRSVFDVLQKYYQTLMQVQNQTWLDNWSFALSLLQSQTEVDSRISGFSYRMRYDLTDIKSSDLGLALEQHLDSVYDPKDQAAWLEGFLFGSGRLLIYHDTLFNRLNDWVKSIDSDVFKTVLPILNRTFAQYASKDRQLIIQKVRGHKNTSTAQEEDASVTQWLDEHLAEALRKLNINPN